MASDESFQIRCSRCKALFRDKARRIQNGYSRQCPSCERIIFFVDGSPDKEIDAAFREAARIRKVLIEEEAENLARRAVRSVKHDDDNQVPANSRYRVNRR
jgi:DNA-directed RNA polymerase subunit RPC12/RpoP